MDDEKLPHLWRVTEHAHEKYKKIEALRATGISTYDAIRRIGVSRDTYYNVKRHVDRGVPVPSPILEKTAPVIKTPKTNRASGVSMQKVPKKPHDETIEKYKQVRALMESGIGRTAALMKIALSPATYNSTRIFFGDPPGAPGPAKGPRISTAFIIPERKPPGPKPGWKNALKQDLTTGTERAFVVVANIKDIANVIRELT